MATVQGTLQGMTLIDHSASGVGDRKAYLCTFSFAAFGNTDVASVSNLQTSIADRVKNGKTFTIRQACGMRPGMDASGAAVYPVGVFTAGSTAGQIDFKLGGVTAAATISTATSGVAVLVVGDES